MEHSPGTRARGTCAAPCPAGTCAPRQSRCQCPPPGGCTPPAACSDADHHQARHPLLLHLCCQAQPSRLWSQPQRCTSAHLYVGSSSREPAAGTSSPGCCGPLGPAAASPSPWAAALASASFTLCACRQEGPSVPRGCAHVLLPRGTPWRRNARLWLRDAHRHDVLVDGAPGELGHGRQVVVVQGLDVVQLRRRRAQASVRAACMGGPVWRRQQDSCARRLPWRALLRCWRC